LTYCAEAIIANTVSNLTITRGLASENSRMLRHRKSERNSVRSLVKTSKDGACTNNEKQTKKKLVPKRIKLDDTLNADTILQLSYNGSKTPTYGLNRLKDSFYDVPCEDLAKELLGKILVRRLNDGTVLKGRIVETECYPGGEDKGSCSYNGRITETIKAVYMKPGTAFVYVTYGMYHCINISSQGLCRYWNVLVLLHSSHVQGSKVL
jgi:DNA-3-methyladenine glycosylase